jgi:hypothetical protein
MPCDGSTSESAATSRRSRAMERRYAASASDSGSPSWTLMLVEMRGSTMSPLMKIRFSGASMAMCSGACPYPAWQFHVAREAVGPIESTMPSSRRRDTAGTAGTRLR